MTFDAATNSFTLDPANAAYQSLAAGQTQVVVVNYGVTDGTTVVAASTQFTVTGTNDAPVVAAPQAMDVLAGGAAFAFNPLANATDADQGTVLQVAGAVPSWMQQTATGFAFNPNDPAFQALAAGEVTTAVWNYGITDGLATVPATASFTVTGNNDAPVTLNLLANAADIDHLDVLAVQNAGASRVTASVTSGVWAAPVAFTVAGNQVIVDPAQFAALGAGKTLGLTFSYTVSDGHANATVADSATLQVQGSYTGPSGVKMADATASLAKAQGGSAITAKTAVATFTQTGGLAQDNYSYALSGAGAGSFSLATSGGVGTLSTGNSGALGTAAMRIELQGTVPLTLANFVHV